MRKDFTKLKQIFSDDSEILNVLQARQQEEESGNQTELLKELVKSQIQFGQNVQFLKGEDYVLTPEDKLEIASMIDVPVVDRVIEKTEVIRETPIITEITKVIKEALPIDENGLTERILSKVPENITAEKVIEFMVSLKGKEAEEFGKKIGSMIDISQIRNAQSFLFHGKRIKFEELMHGGGSSTGGSTLTVETPVGIVDDSNVTFIVTHEPIYIVVNGAQYNVGTGTYQSYVTGTITLTSPVGIGGFIRSYYNS